MDVTVCGASSSAFALIFPIVPAAMVRRYTNEVQDTNGDRRPGRLLRRIGHGFPAYR